MNTEQLCTAMVEQMVEASRLRSQPWIAAFTRLPRHAFLPRFFRQSPDLSGWLAISAEDPGAPELIYSDATWVTQLDNDPDRWQTAHDSGKPAYGIATSSSTAPGLMALMLEALDVQEGHRVLEIGTGTGYNAALLCHRLAATLVTTVEVDPTVAEAARGALLACGKAPTLVVADGTHGHSAGAPYDRLIATCSTPTIPAAWIEQVRPGGLILTSLHRDFGGGPLVLLHVDEHGRAEGRFMRDYGGFMPVRTSPPAEPAQRLDTALDEDPDERRTTTLHPELLDHPDFGMLAALCLPGVATMGFVPATGPQRWLLADDGSWACVDESGGEVAQRGPRRLWDEAEEIYAVWQATGQPARDQYGLTVDGDGGQWLWLGHPSQSVPKGSVAAPLKVPGRVAAPGAEASGNSPACSEPIA